MKTCELQPNETAQAYEVFTQYLAMGPTRSLAKIARKTGWGHAAVEKWSAKYNWKDRVADYVRHIAEVEHEAAEAAAKARGVDWGVRYAQLREAEWQERIGLLQFAAEIRQRWLDKGDLCGTLDGYARLIQLASKLGHSACEKAAERQEITGPGGGPLQVEIAAALKRVYGEPLPGEVIDVSVVDPLPSPGAQTPDALPAAAPDNPKLDPREG